MRRPPFTRAFLLASLLAPCALPALTTVFNVGVIDNTGNEFEHEANADALYYYEAGDYSSLQAYGDTRTLSLNGAVASGAESLNDNTANNIGFRRAWTGSVPANNVFFQLTPEEASGKLQLAVKAANGDASHNIQFYLNGNAVGSKTLSDPINGPIQVLEFNAPAAGARNGSNVLSAVSTTTSGYRIVDFMTLQALHPKNVFSIGLNNGNNSDFEPEGGNNNNPRFNVHAGNYTTVLGQTGYGENALAAEPWQNLSNADGMPRALVGTGEASTVDLFFQLTQDQINQGQGQLEVDLVQLGGASSHDLEFRLNGLLLDTALGISADRLFTDSFFFSDFGVTAGSQVLSIRRTGGSTTNPWIQFDYISLNAVPEPTKAVFVGLAALLGVTRRSRRQTA